MRPLAPGVVSLVAFCLLFSACSSDDHAASVTRPQLPTPDATAAAVPAPASGAAPNETVSAAQPKVAQPPLPPARKADGAAPRPGAGGPATSGPAGPTTGGPHVPSTPGPSGPATGGPAGPTTGGVVTASDEFFLGATRTPLDTESYAASPEVGFTATEASRLSTFAADVDTAAYANLRRFLAEGSLPPATAVRVEEIVNAQSYRDPAPDGREPFAITTELGACPWQREHLLLRIGLRTRPIDAAKVPPCNLVFLIDVSGSMSSPDKLPLVVRSMALLAEQLRPQDRLSIVTYANGVNEPLPSATGADRLRILEVLTNLRASGGTNGEGGIQRAYELAAKHRIAEGVNRVLLATDGDFNVGINDPAELERFIAARKDAGVFLTVLGVGSGNLKDDRLERLANKGNGVYAYLDSLAEARRVLVEQFGASMMTVAKDVKLQLEFDPARIARWRQIGYENRQLTAREFRDDKKDAGELGAGHSMTALYELVPADAPNGGTSPIATLRVRYKPPLADATRELSRPVAGAVAVRPSRDFRVAAVAAALGMLLRGSAHTGTLGWDDLAAMAASPGLDAPDLARTVAAAHRLQPPSQPER